MPSRSDNLNKTNYSDNITENEPTIEDFNKFDNLFIEFGNTNISLQTLSSQHLNYYTPPVYINFFFDFNDFQSKTFFTKDNNLSNETNSTQCNLFKNNICSEFTLIISKKFNLYLKLKLFKANINFENQKYPINIYEAEYSGMKFVSYSNKLMYITGQSFGNIKLPSAYFVDSTNIYADREWKLLINFPGTLKYSSSSYNKKCRLSGAYLENINLTCVFTNQFTSEQEELTWPITIEN